MAKVALLIGVSDYEPGLNPLPGSVNDVDAIQRVLADPELGGFAETDITVLKNPQRQEMEEAIYRLFSERKKDDLLLFYFSGHGIKDESGRLYLATRATRKDGNGRLIKPSAVAAVSLHENINESRSQRQVIVLDCCFSGAIAQGMTVKDDGTVNVQEFLGGKGRAILTSSTSTEYSFGSEAVGREAAGLSIYTHYLVEGIETGAADLDDDGFIAVEELHEYAVSRVKEAAPAMTPKFYPVEEGYKILLAKSRKDDPQLKYRKEVQARAAQGHGTFSIPARRLLEGKRDEWGLSAAEANLIEAEVLQPYRDYERKLKDYEQTLMETAQVEYPFSAVTEAELNDYQQHLGLQDTDIAAIAARVLAPFKAASQPGVDQTQRSTAVMPSTPEQPEAPVLSPPEAIANATKGIAVFFSYARKDEALRDELATHLAMMKRQGLITGWYDRDISAGDEWEAASLKHLHSAQIILLLISNHFLASDVCYDNEMLQAMTRHESGEARVIPIIIKPCDWSGAPFGKLQALPKDAKPVTKWNDRDEAWLNVAQGIRNVVETIAQSKPTASVTNASPTTLAASAPIPAASSATGALTSRQRRRLQDELTSLQQTYDLLSRKLNNLRQARTIETDVSVKLKLDVQIEEATTDLETVEQQLDHLESQLR